MLYHYFILFQKMHFWIMFGAHPNVNLWMKKCNCRAEISQAKDGVERELENGFWVLVFLCTFVFVETAYAVFFYWFCSLSWFLEVVDESRGVMLRWDFDKIDLIKGGGFDIIWGHVFFTFFLIKSILSKALKVFKLLHEPF